MTKQEIFDYLKENLKISEIWRDYSSNNVDLQLELKNPLTEKFESISQVNVHIPSCSCDREGYY